MRCTCGWAARSTGSGRREPGKATPSRSGSRDDRKGASSGNACAVADAVVTAHSKATCRRWCRNRRARATARARRRLVDSHVVHPQPTGCPRRSSNGRNGHGSTSRQQSTARIPYSANYMPTRPRLPSQIQSDPQWMVVPDASKNPAHGGVVTKCLHSTAVTQADPSHRPNAARPLSRARACTISCALATLPVRSCDHSFSAACCMARP